MMLSRSTLWLVFAAILCMAGASYAGIFDEDTYARETASWSAQGYGQDLANLFIVFPLALGLIFHSFKGSRRSSLILVGINIYIAYSYVLYSFFVSFGPVFLLYVAVLGLSFFSMLRSIFELIGSAPFDISRGPEKGLGLYLMINGAVFAFLWLSEIFTALREGSVPVSAAEIGFAINPVHVLDLGFLLPSMLIAGISLWKKRWMGRMLAIPLATFAVVMGFAITVMIAVLDLRGLSDTWTVGLIMGANISAGIILVWWFLKNIKEPVLLKYGHEG